MPKTFTPELIKILKQAGCSFMRSGKGDHQIWYSPLTDRNFTLDAAIKSRHTANAILKQAGLPKLF
jgi:predicted RNA binding protein YcfA (HicA-like mRNA interferase family)